MKRKILLLCLRFYWKICFRLYLFLLKEFSYAYYLRVFEAVCKVKDVKTNVLSKEQKQEIDSFYKKNYGKKIPYIWHNFIVNLNNKFDVRYMTPRIFIKITEKLNSNLDSVIYDKNFLYNIANSANIKVPKRFFYSIKNLFFDFDNNMISKEDFYKGMSNIGEVFIKPTQIINSGYAKNCRLINVIDGVDVYSGEKIKNIVEKDYNKDFIVQERVVCHESISAIYPNSVNTFSIYTFIWNGEVKTINKPVLKIGMNGSVTDYSGIQKEGLIISIDNEGVLPESALCINQYKWYDSHPNTGLIFKNHKIKNFPKVFEVAKKLHSRIPWLGFCKWDISIDIDGEPVLMEVESPGEMLQQQVLYKEGFFGEYTEELLHWLKNKK